MRRNGSRALVPLLAICIFVAGALSAANVTYVPGNIPFIVTAPHGGSLEPAGIPDRKPTGGAVLIGDMYTSGMAHALFETVAEHYGGCSRPHLVVFNVHRRKVDANRPIETGTDSEGGQAAWKEYHDAVQEAVDHVMATHDYGLLLDIHGHAHPHGLVELGYLLHKADLAKWADDPEATDKAVLGQSSIQSLARRASQLQPHALLRGDGSLGDMLGKAGIQSVPSPSHLYPQPNERYFRGGYTVQAYHTNSSSHDGGTRGMDAIQIELPKQWRFTDAARAKAVGAIADAARQMLDAHYFPARMREAKL